VARTVDGSAAAVVTVEEAIAVTVSSAVVPYAAVRHCALFLTRLPLFRKVASLFLVVGEPPGTGRARRRPRAVRQGDAGGPGPSGRPAARGECHRPGPTFRQKEIGQ
jgi:hypothetical protein